MYGRRLLKGAAEELILDPGEPLFGKSAAEWPDGIYWLEGEPEIEIDPLFAAAERYRRRFGTPPGTFFPSKTWPRLIELIDAAIARGRPLSMEETYRGLGMEPPPPDAVT